MRRLSSVDDEEARCAVQVLTTDQREDLFRFAQSVLPDGHQLKCRIGSLAPRIGLRFGPIVDHALAAEIEETAIEAWREIEVLKDAAGRESARMIGEYRRDRLAKVEQYLALGSVAEHELDDLKKAFADADERHPDLSGWVYMNELPRPTGPGTLHFLELANRAGRAFARAGAEDTWKYWLEILVGYLLQNDLDEEHIQQFSVGHLYRPQGTTPETHPGVIIQGENYEIRHLFKASEECCSWLKRRRWNDSDKITEGVPRPRALPRQPKNGEIESVRVSARKMLAEGATHQQVCQRLDDAVRPPRAEWRHLRWDKAYLSDRFRGSVCKWLSKNCRS